LNLILASLPVGCTILSRPFPSVSLNFFISRMRKIGLPTHWYFVNI
jgi:hypothetical protein